MSRMIFIRSEDSGMRFMGEGRISDFVRCQQE